MNYYPVGIYTGMRRGVGSRLVVATSGGEIIWCPKNREKELHKECVSDFQVWLEIGNCIYEGEA